MADCAATSDRTYRAVERVAAAVSFGYQRAKLDVQPRWKADGRTMRRFLLRTKDLMRSACFRSSPTGAGRSDGNLLTDSKINYNQASLFYGLYRRKSG